MGGTWDPALGAARAPAAPGAPAAPPDHLAPARDLIALQRQLSALAAQRADPAVVTELLAERFGAPFWVVNEALSVIAASAPDITGTDVDVEVDFDRWSTHLRWDRILQVASTTRSVVRAPETDTSDPLLIVPVLVDFEVSAFLVTVEPRLRLRSDLTILAMEHAATVCGVMLSRERVVTAAAGRARDDLLEGLLLGNTLDVDELERWGRHLGLDSRVPHRVVLFTYAGADPASVLAPERRDRIAQVVKHFCESRSADVLTVARDDEVVAVAADIPSKGPGPCELAGECVTYCRDLFPGVRVTAAVSDSCYHLPAIGAAYRDVRRTTSALGRVGHHGEVVVLEDLGLQRLLLQVPDLQELRAFADDVLGPLVRYDRRHSRQLIETLASFFRNAGVVRRIADELHVHPNTVTYRLKRCNELGQFDLDRYRDRLAVQVAIEILDLLGPVDG